MHFDRGKYETLIAESELFSVDKEEAPSAYRRESLKIAEYLYCYLMAVNEREYEPYACEIMEVSARCIKNYDCSKGVFLHYFNAAWKQEYSHIISDKMIDDKLHGMSITDEERRYIVKYLKLAERLQTDCTKDELYRKISDALQIPVEKVVHVAEISSICVSGESAENSDGEEICQWDMISEGASIDDYLADSETLELFLSKIETVFSALQERQKPIVSDMITARIWTAISKQQEETYSFISRDIIKACRISGRAPSQRAIAEKHGRNEASISRTVKEFLNKLKNSLREV